MKTETAAMMIFALQALVMHQVGQALLFEKRIPASNVTAVATLFAPTYSKNMGSLIECAALAMSTLRNPVKSQRASAFHFTNGTLCQLGQTPPYLDALAAMTTITNGSDGIHACMSLKPLASVVLADIWAYLLINEQEYFDHDPNLGIHNPAGYDGVTTTFEFTTISPVQTLEGMYAANSVNNAYLEYTLGTPATFSALTFLIWYNSGANVASNEPLLAFLQGTAMTSGFNLWLGAYNPADMDFTLEYSGYQEFYTSSSQSPLFPAMDWVYIGVSMDFVNGLVTFYTNATEQGQWPIDEILMTGITTVQVGYRLNYWGTYYMKGTIASLEVYDSYMDAATVEEMMLKSTTIRVGM